MIELIKSLLRRGIRIRISDGPMFDPTAQERTDPVRDIIEKEEKRGKDKGRA